MPRVDLVSVSKTFRTGTGEVPAVAGVSLTIDEGEFFCCVVGPSGCGKSTLLKVLDGLYRPSAGLVEAFGQDVTAAADDPSLALWLHRRVGLVFQDADVQLFSPTVWDDVAFGPLQMGWLAQPRVSAASAPRRK